MSFMIPLSRSVDPRDKPIYSQKFDEDKHPREANGRFGAGDGGGDAPGGDDNGGESTDADRAANDAFARGPMGSPSQEARDAANDISPEEMEMGAGVGMEISFEEHGEDREKLIGAYFDQASYELSENTNDPLPKEKLDVLKADPYWQTAAAARVDSYLKDLEDQKDDTKRVKFGKQVRAAMAKLRSRKS